MRRFFAFALALVVAIAIAATALAVDIDYASLSDAELDEIIKDAAAQRRSRQITHVPVTVNASPDKYTWYIQDYVGRNAAGFGYTSLGGDRLEKYGAGLVEFIFITEDGSLIDIKDKNLLQQYVVTGQNIEPNTEMKLTFQKDSAGREYGNLIDCQSIETIDLSVRRIDGALYGELIPFELIPIKPSPDRYTYYIRNYVGKNVMSFGYASLGGYRMDEYGAGRIRFNFVTDDGAYLDPGDKDTMRQYVVTKQDVAPNTELKLTFQKNSAGVEYDSLVDTMSYEGITLYVHKLDIAYPETTAEPELEPEPEPAVKTDIANGTIRSYRDVSYRLLNDGTAEICALAHANDSITIPSTIDDYKVTRIADGAFENCAELKEIINWADLTYIGKSAFKGCSKLKEISIPGATKFIGESAFEDCASLKSVIIWGNPVAIEKNTFKNCVKLKEISIPSSAKYIDESAFEGCTAIKTVIIWGNITRVGKNAFKNCSSLDEISIPSSTQIIEESAFEGCVDMDSVILWGDTNIGEAAFRGCVSIEDISISSGTEFIGDYAFEGCLSLEDVIMWGDSTKIGKDAFANCPELKRVPR